MSSPSRLVISSISNGLQTYDKPFLLDNDAFPVLENALCFRKRLIKKPGTSKLGRLQRSITSESAGTLTTPWSSFSGTLAKPSENYSSLIVHVDATITGATQANPCVLTVTNNFNVGQTVTITNVVGMTQLNGNSYLITAQTGASITLNVDSTGFGGYSSGGTASVFGQVYRNITAISNANPVTITSNSHNLTNGLTVSILGVLGMTEINGITAVVSGVTANTFQLTGVDSTTFSTYASGGTAQTLYNPATGTFTAQFNPAFLGNVTVLADYSYYPSLPALGVEQFEADATATAQIDFPTNVFFDQNYAYETNGTSFFDVSFYKNTGAPVTWSGQNYQQFYSANYFRAMFVSNNNPGSFNFAIASISNATPAVVTVTLPAGVTDMRLQTGDYVFINECTGASSASVNMQSFKIIRLSATTFSISPGGLTINAASGVVFPLTRLITLDTGSSAQTGDGIRWYDGFGAALGFVNFTPPLDGNSNTATTYLVGARILIPFGNRLLAIGTFEDTSANIRAGNTPVYYGNRIRYCQLSPGTPFYSQGPSNTDTLYPANSPLPTTFSAALATIANSSWTQTQGYGGFIDLDTTQRIISAGITQGSLILGLEAQQRSVRLTGIESDPFSTQVINPDYGTAGTYAVIPMDKGIFTAGEYGFLMTSSYSADRFDQKIIDQIFSVNGNDNGFERISGARDFRNEILYFTYLSDDADASNIYPNRTVVYNYREGNFAVWKETYSTYGIYKISNTQTWPTYTTLWENWQDNWEDLGGDQYIEPFVAGGTPQGYVMLKWADDSQNAPSMQITAISTLNANNTYTVTSPNHNLEQGMFIGFWPPGATSPSFNGSINTILSSSTFTVTFDATASPGNISPGFWEMSLIDNINIQTKQFPLAWSNAQKTRIGAQKYFLDRTAQGEFTVNIFGSQTQIPLNNNNLANPLPSLISNAVVRTRPDDSLGINAGQSNQTQIWHRLASSCIGDTVQLQFTFSPTQLYSVPISTSPWVMHSIILDLYPSRTLA